jgi:tetratricopeptide (TPR) repeat protein
MQGGIMPPAPVPAPIKVPQVFAQALELHKQGRLTEAEQFYSEVLAHRPDHFDALQMLSVIKLAKGQPAEALRLISEAMRMRRPSPQILVNHGMILHALDRSEEALACFDAALKQKSKFAEAHNNRGAVLAALGRHEEAVACFHKALALKTDYADAHYNLGSSLRVLGRYDEALVGLDRALLLRPDYVKALNNRGAVLEAINRLPEALACYDRAVALAPGFTESRNNRGRVLLALDRADDAIDNFTAALKFNPDDAEAWYQRGRCLLEISRNEEAAADLAQALALAPGHADARFAACFAELPVIYRDESEIAQCRAAYEQKLRELLNDVERGVLKGDLIKAIGARHPFLLAYQGSNDRALQQIYGEMIGKVIARRFSPAPLPPPPAPGEPIRVGIVSSFFYRHSNWKIPIKGWISQLDRSRFHVTGYHLGAIHDEQTDAAARLCDRFVHRTLDTDGWRREILADAPHALIYPGLLMDVSSLQLAAQRLASVQCNSWGHPETSGLSTIDYFLSSDLMEPPDDKPATLKSWCGCQIFRSITSRPWLNRFPSRARDWACAPERPRFGALNHSLNICRSTTTCSCASRRPLVIANSCSCAISVRQGLRSSCANGLSAHFQRRACAPSITAFFSTV